MVQAYEKQCHPLLVVGNGIFCGCNLSGISLVPYHTIGASEQLHECLKHGTFSHTDFKV